MFIPKSESVALESGGYLPRQMRGRLKDIFFLSTYSFKYWFLTSELMGSPQEKIHKKNSVNACSMTEHSEDGRRSEQD